MTRAPNDIRRHVVEIDGRHVHMRVAGRGAPVVLLHESPRSSAAVLPLIERLAARFSVYAPDTPGNGLSDPLNRSDPAIADYADALAALLDRLGLERVVIYGTHTGAEIAMESGLRHPHRVERLILEGYPVFPRAVQEEALRLYLPSFPPDWSGAHMAALWSRVRDQFLFFPWYARGETGRLAWEPRPLEAHDAVLSDLLAAGDGYRAPYAAAFAYEAAEGVRRAAALRAEGRLATTYLTRSDDMLFPYLETVRGLDPGAEILPLGPDRDVWARTIETAAAAASLPDAPALPPQASTMRFVDGDLLVRRYGPAEDRDTAALLLLHGHPGAGGALRAEALDAARRGPVYVPDLPGSGHSAPLPSGPDLAERMARRIADALPDRPLRQRAHFTGGRVADALHRLRPEHFGAPELVDPLPTDADALGELRRRWHLPLPSNAHGGHVLGAWHRARDGLLQHPWYDHRTAARRSLPADINLDGILATAEAILAGRAHEASILEDLLAPPP